MRYFFGREDAFLKCLDTSWGSLIIFIPEFRRRKSTALAVGAVSCLIELIYDR